jgi:translocation and assembly module TamB
MSIRSIVSSFTLVIFLFLIGGVYYLQSKSFGRLITKIATDIAEKKTKTKVKIDSLDFTVYPLGITLNKVAVQKSAENLVINLELGEINLSLNLMEIEDQRISFGEMKFKDAFFHIDSPETSQELKELPKKWIDELFKYPEVLPLAIDTITLENVGVNYNKLGFLVKRLKLFKEDSKFKVRLFLANVENSELSDISIDEIHSELEIDRKNIELQKLKINKDTHSITLFGDIKNYRLLKNAEVKISGDSDIYLPGIKNLFSQNLLDINSGKLQGQFEIEYEKEQIRSQLKLMIKNADTNLIVADEIQTEIAIENKSVWVNSFTLKDKSGIIKLNEKIKVYSNLHKRFEMGRINLNANSIDLKNALRFLGEKRNLISARASGNLQIRIKDKNIYLDPSDGFKLEGFQLGEKTAILKINEIKLTNSTLFFENNKFYIFSDILLKNSRLRAEGFISKDESNLKVLESKIDLEDLGGIAGLGIRGNGKLDLQILGGIKNLGLFFDGNVSEFEILNYHLGSSQLGLEIQLGESKVIIKDLESKYGKTKIFGDGFVNYSTEEISLGLSSTKSNFADLKKIISPVLSRINFLPKDLFFESQLDVSIFGKYNLKDLKLKSEAKLNNISLFDENVDSGYLNINLNNQKLSFENVIFKKDKGILSGGFEIGLENKRMKSNFKWDNIWLSSFSRLQKFDINTYLHGELKLQGDLANYELLITNGLAETRAGIHKLKDSEMTLELKPNYLNLDFNFFRGEFAGIVHHRLKGAKKSFFDVEINTNNVGPLLIAFLGDHLNDDTISKSSLRLNLKGDYLREFENLNLGVMLNNVNFKSKNHEIIFSGNKDQVRVENGVIRNWDIDINARDFLFSSKGRGNVPGNFNVNNRLNLSARYLELFSPRILLAEGEIKNNLNFSFQNDVFYFLANSKSEKISLSFSDSFLPLNDVKYSIRMEDKRLNIDELKLKLENGFISLKGDAFFQKGIPDINLKFQLDRAEIPILKKSSANISGEGIIVGTEMPYVISGDFDFNKLLILNELSDFQKKSVSEVKYLPQAQESILSKIFKLNVKTNFSTPLKITNSLMDISLTGVLNFEGNLLKPICSGRLSTPPNSSRVFFKNNEYQINNSDINFSPKKEISNPDFDIQASTLISNYKIQAKAYGDLERFNFDLSSDPALPKNSILSLIAFGYTDEIQNTLSQDEQQSLTQMGVGSFVFDRFKISDILNKQFGLQINLGTVFEQSQTQSMLSGRSQDSSNGLVGRTRSATKIELKKRLDEATTLSVSSTMGGSIGQRQSMNLTYNLTKKVQLEGVYELRTNAEGEEDIIDNSIGGDVKFRWTFK